MSLILLAQLRFGLAARGVRQLWFLRLCSCSWKSKLSRCVGRVRIDGRACLVVGWWRLVACGIAIWLGRRQDGCLCRHSMPPAIGGSSGSQGKDLISLSPGNLHRDSPGLGSGWFAMRRCRKNRGRLQGCVLTRMAFPGPYRTSPQKPSTCLPTTSQMRRPSPHTVSVVGDQHLDNCSSSPLLNSMPWETGKNGGRPRRRHQCLCIIQERSTQQVCVWSTCWCCASLKSVNLKLGRLCQLQCCDRLWHQPVRLWIDPSTEMHRLGGPNPCQPTRPRNNWYYRRASLTRRRSESITESEQVISSLRNIEFHKLVAERHVGDWIHQSYRNSYVGPVLPSVKGYMATGRSQVHLMVEGPSSLCSYKQSSSKAADRLSSPMITTSMHEAMAWGRPLCESCWAKAPSSLQQKLRELWYWIFRAGSQPGSVGGKRGACVPCLVIDQSEWDLFVWGGVYVVFTSAGGGVPWGWSCIYLCSYNIAFPPPSCLHTIHVDCMRVVCRPGWQAGWVAGGVSSTTYSSLGDKHRDFFP